MEDIRNTRFGINLKIKVYKTCSRSKWGVNGGVRKKGNHFDPQNFGPRNWVNGGEIC